MRAMARRWVPGAESSTSRCSSGESAPRSSSREGPWTVAWAMRNPASDSEPCERDGRSSMTRAGSTTGVAPGVMAFCAPSGAVVTRPRENASWASAGA